MLYFLFCCFYTFLLCGHMMIIVIIFFIVYCAPSTEKERIFRTKRHVNANKCQIRTCTHTRSLIFIIFRFKRTTNVWIQIFLLVFFCISQFRKSFLLNSFVNYFKFIWFFKKKNVRQLLYDGCLLNISVCTKSKNERKKNWENCSFVVVEVIKSFALNGALWLHSLLNLPTKHAFAADLVCLLLLLSLFAFQSNIFFNLEFIAIAIYLVLR